ncbi:DNA-dependent metalloprotease SPRTN-like [Schistocerca cancellata]|uniref:DNA-dependent metalloprotease SPRTN-like n=1 Tax=Schistocerca cancellata TaxID=274614 RepID=UPI0021173DD7|nr:DNA-dependent metalloprotease SPRTN-like [Schistocerca cancellata]
MMFDDDLALQLQLQDMNRQPSIMDLPDDSSTHRWKSRKQSENEDPNKKPVTLIDPSFEYIDPTPDVHAMFLQFNSRFFWGKLYAVEVRWSPRMTSCAGVCCYEGRGGLCSIRLSAPLLKLRPRKDLVETLLHEMIHAYLFVTNNDRDRDGHGPEFHKHMYRINKEAGTKISVYHNFHDEVKLYQQHWWRCNGPCQKWPPYFGMVKRAMNRPPGPTDFWWANHQAKCGGTYIKVREPEGFSKKKTGHAPVKGTATVSKERNDIRNFFPFTGEGKALATSSSHNKARPVSDGKCPSEKDTLRNTDMVTSNKRGPSDLVHHGPVSANSFIKGAPIAKDKNVGVKGLFDKPVLNNHSKNVTNSKNNLLSNNKSNSPIGSSPNNKFGKAQIGGMLANKGNGTMVITQKGNKQTQKKSSGANDSAPQRSVSAPVTPFVGKGYTVGSSSSCQPVPAATEKPWLSLLDKIEADRKKKKHLSSLTIDKGFSTTKMVKSNEIIKNESKMKNSSESMRSPPKKFKNDPATKPFFTSDVGSNNKIHSSRDINSQAQSSANGSLEVMVNCPTCGKLVEEHAINSHLDICLQYRAEDTPASQNVANCPICNKNFPLNEINSHVDVCLSNNDDSTSVTMEEEDEMIKCPMCDEKLLKHTLNVHLESCILCITKADACFIEDEDDCESEVNDAIGSDGGEDLHPCPLCMKLVKENLMNIHLDDCLSADILQEMAQE